MLARRAVLLVIVAVPAMAQGTEFAIRATGLSFPAAVPAQGEALEILGLVDVAEASPPFPLSPDAEYTWTVTGPTVLEIVEPAPGIRYLSLSFGVMEIREDPSRNANYEPNPPNSSVPASFRDGRMLLLGEMTEFEIREVFGVFTATGDVRFEGGEALPGLGEAVEWTLRAALSSHGDPVPAGFGWRWTLDLAPRQSVEVEPGSWGEIKSLYR